MRAVTARPEPWAPAGHVLATGQLFLGHAPSPPPGAPVPLLRTGSDLHLGPGVFDARTGALLALGALPVAGPRLDLWRAPTDNDLGRHGERVAEAWRTLGLDRLRHRTASVEAGADTLRVTTRVAPAGSDVAFTATYTWCGGDGWLRLDVEAAPDAELPCPLPLVGIRLRLPRELSTVEWFGRGPGEAYPDTGYATTVGRFLSTVDGMQTPYVFPQENGRRADVRWAVLSGPGGGLRLSADRPLGLTVRRWTSEQLDRARHTAELSDEGYVYVGVDAGQQGIGTASCGPGPLPRYRLGAGPARLGVVLRPMPVSFG